MISKYVSAADVLILPYLKNAGSDLANIAMAYGKPIIILDLETIESA